MKETKIIKNKNKVFYRKIKLNNRIERKLKEKKRIQYKTSTIYFYCCFRRIQNY